MALTLTQADYNYNYYNGGGAIGGYDAYSATTYSSQTAMQLAQSFITISGLSGINLYNCKVLVIGCAYGFLPQAFVSLGVNTFGFDFSSYAISQVPADVSSRVFLGDARLETPYQQAKLLAGLSKPNDKFDLIIDEDMFPCLTDSEAVTTRTWCLKYSNMFYHLIDLSPSMSQWYNYKTIAEWKTLLGTSPKEKWVERFTSTVS